MEEKEQGEVKKRMTVEDIGDVVKDSGFKTNPKELGGAIGLLERLEDFMTIEGKNGQSSEDQIRALERQGILTKEQAKKALESAKTKKKEAGGVQYDEDNRKSINFSRTTVSHVGRLLTAIKG